MKDKSRTMKPMGKEPISILFRIMNILAVGIKISLMEKENKNSETDHIMKANFNMGQRKDMVTMFVNQESIKVNFLKGTLVEREPSAIQMAGLIKANGRMDF